MVRFIKISILFAVPFLLFNSCLKEENPLPKHQQGNIHTTTIEIGYPYTYQVFYNCGSNSVVSTNSKFDWDLGFESNGYHIKLNTSRAIFVADMKSSNFDSTYSIVNVQWLWDHENGELEQTALNKWVKPINLTYIYSNKVYILDRSFDADGKHLGFYKIQFLKVDDTSFEFQYALLDGSQKNIIKINKNASVNFTCFSFNSGGKTVDIEPNKNTWDLRFTNYQHKFSNLTLPFVLTQCLTNKYDGVTSAEINSPNFKEIELKDTHKFTFTNQYDEIGYNWKIRNSQDNSFEIDPNKFFIVRTKKGFYYKLRFIDFYNEKGLKGYPKFEIQKL